MWCITAISKEYRERMYRPLDLYRGTMNGFRWFTCLPAAGRDEKSKQLTMDARGTIGLKPGSPAKYDYEYKRNGTRNIFVAVGLPGRKTNNKSDLYQK